MNGFACPGKSWENFYLFSILKANPASLPLLSENISKRLASSLLQTVLLLKLLLICKIGECVLLGRTKIDRGSAATVATDSLTGEVTQELVTKERRFCFGLLVFFFFFPLAK